MFGDPPENLDRKIKIDDTAEESNSQQRTD
jgi:hypothetical protein